MKMEMNIEYPGFVVKFMQQHKEAIVEVFKKNNGKWWVTMMEACPRCGGTGHFSYNEVDGTICLKCRGKKVVRNTKRILTEGEIESRKKSKKRNADKKRIESEKKHQEFLKKKKEFLDSTVWIVNYEDTYSIKDELKKYGAEYDPFIKWYFKRKPSQLDYELIEINISDFFEDFKCPVPGFTEKYKKLFIDPSTEESELKVEQCFSSQYFGEKNEKFEKCLTYCETKSFSNNFYGQTHYHFFIDSEENLFLWKTGTYPDWINESFEGKLKFTIKDHQEYQGIKQTLILRVKVADK